MEFKPAHTLPEGKLPTRLEPFNDSRPRYLFYKAVEDYTPEVLEHLRDRVLPFYEALTPGKAIESYSNVGLKPAERVGPSLDIDPEFASDFPVSWWRVEQGASKTSEASALHMAIAKWSEKFHLTDEWLLDLALHTLFYWRELKEKGQPIKLRWHRLPFGGMGLFDGQADDFEVRDVGWNLNDEEWPQFRKRVQSAFRKCLGEYQRRTLEIALNGGWSKGPDIRDRRRFKWLALWQVREMSAYKILEWDQSNTWESNLAKQVKATADLVGVTLRPARKGRHRESQNRN